MDARFRPPLLRKDGVAVELGAAPGSWSQVLVAKGMRVIAVDMLPLEPLVGVDFVKGDFTEKTVQQDVVGQLNGELCDLLLSDVSPNRSGNKSLDEARLVALLEQSFSFARKVLRPGGSFVGKVLQGSELQPLLQLSRRFFSSGWASSRMPSSGRRPSRISCRRFRCFSVASGMLCASSITSRW
jgi:23S rRNA (uridine2552-2'-O)-methyltransferase